MRAPARPNRVHTRIPPIRRDPPQRQRQLLLPKRCQRQERLEVPPHAALGRALVLDRPAGDGARVEEERGTGVGDLDAGSLGEALEEAEEGDLVGVQAGVVGVGADGGDPDWPPGKEREDQPCGAGGGGGKVSSKYYVTGLSARKRAPGYASITSGRLTMPEVFVSRE